MKESRKGFTYVYNNRIYVLSFTIPVIIMLVIFVMAGVCPFGDRSFLHIDMYHQYFPFLTDFYHVVRGKGAGSDGSGFFYSLNSGLGNNFYALWAYYLSSPLNLFALLVPEKFLMEFFSYLAIVKIGLCGLAFSIYFKHHFEREDIGIVFFSVFYALSGYIAAYNWDLMWLDVVALSPIVILGLERLVSSGGRFVKLYTISLAVSLFCNYYLCIMLCIFLTLYFLLVLFPGAKEKIRSAVAFGLSSLLSGAMAAVILLPSYMAIRMTRFHSSNFPSSFKPYFSVFDMSARHLMDVAVETGLDHWPNIYASVAVLLLLPLYIVSRRIPLREKIGRLVLLVFLFYSFSVNVLSYLWHGLNYPDSLPARQSYLYIFLLLVMCYEGYMHIIEQSKAAIGAVAVAVMIYLTCVQKLVKDDAITERTIALSAVAAVIYMLLIYIFRNVAAEEADSESEGAGNKPVKRKKAIRVLGYVTLGVVIVEASVNMNLTSVPTVSRSSYLKNYSDYKSLYETFNELPEGNFYRFERENRLTNNDAMLKSYPSISLFSSISNGLVNDFYSDYGMRTSKVFYCADGVTPFIRAMLGNKYVFVEDKDSEQWNAMMMPDKDVGIAVSHIGLSGTVGMYEYEDSLPVGYMLYPEKCDEEALIFTYEELKDKEKEDVTPVIRQNVLATALGGGGPLYIEALKVEQTDRADIIIHEDGYYIAYCDTKKIDTLKVKLPSGDRDYKKLKNPYIINLGYLEAGDSVDISNDDGADLHMKLYVTDEDIYKKVISGLSRDTFKISEGGYKSGRLFGSIEAKEDGYMILSIPYDKSWHIYVDGIKTEAKVAYGMMTAVPLNLGRHIVELKYVPGGLAAGTVISIIAIAIFILSVLNRNKKFFS